MKVPDPVFSKIANKEMSPTKEKNRLQHIDSLRGFSLLGILIVNMLSFQYGSVGSEFIYPQLSTIDKVTHDIIQLFFQGSFYPIYSILFGFGAVMIYENVISKQKPFYLLYTRRLFILMAFGFIHLYFIWDGDILLNYAITGFIFIFFINKRPKTLLTIAITLAVFINLPAFIQDDTDSSSDSFFHTYIEKEQEALSDGSYRDVVLHRFTDNPYEDIYMGESLQPNEQEAMTTILSFFNFVMITIQTFMLFLLGAFLAKNRWLHEPTKYLNVLKKIVLFAFPIGFLLKVGMVFTSNESLDYLGYFLGGPILAFAYISLFTIFFANNKEAKIAKGFAYAGRMALTNYLVHSIVMTILFYGYGLGLFGKLGVTIGTFLAALLFIIQVFYSKWWFTLFHYGPVEAFWRMGTYLRPQKIKR